MSKVCGVILASGQSKRMGRDKLLLRWRGKSLLEHVLSTAAQSRLDDIVLLIPCGAKEHLNLAQKYRCRPFYNSDPSLGMGHSLAIATQQIPNSADAVIILLADQPRLKFTDLDRVIDIYKMYQDQKIIIQTQYRDEMIGHPVLFSKHFFSDLEQLTGDQGGKGIIQANLKYVVRYHSPNHYPVDIDNPEDYQKLLKSDGNLKEVEVYE